MKLKNKIFTLCCISALCVVLTGCIATTPEADRVSYNLS